MEGRAFRLRRPLQIPRGTLSSPSPFSFPQDGRRPGWTSRRSYENVPSIRSLPLLPRVLQSDVNPFFTLLHGSVLSEEYDRRSGRRRSSCHGVRLLAPEREGIRFFLRDILSFGMHRGNLSAAPSVISSRAVDAPPPVPDQGLLASEALSLQRFPSLMTSPPPHPACRAPDPRTTLSVFQSLPVW